MIRVTESTVTANYLSNVNQTRARIVQLQGQLASGKRVNVSSDDPSAADTILRLNGAIARSEQYEKNVTDGQSMVDTTGSSLNDFVNHLIEIKEILVRAKGGAEADVLKVHAERLDQILSELVDTANTKFNGKYIFGGTNTTAQPFTLNAARSAVTANPAGITGTIEFQVGEGIKQTVNIDGQEAFNGVQIFSLIIQIRDAMMNGQEPTPAQADALNTALDDVSNKVGKSGSMSANLTSIQSRLLDQRIQLFGLLSQQQDTDIAEATLRLKHEEIMLDAALNTGARIIPKSLLDYLP